MYIEEITSKLQEKQFIKFAVDLYKDEPRWIRPLDKEINDIFDRKKNIFLKEGSCIRWLLKDEKGSVLGRVAAFIHPKVVSSKEYSIGGMGFFECVNDTSLAFLLFEACEKWLKERGMQAMEGPINFGPRNKWWGLLVDGFELEPNFCVPYNFPHYQAFFEAYGFKNYFDQFTFGKKISQPLQPKLQAKAEKILHQKEYRFEYINKNKLDKYTQDFKYIYNKAWVKFEGNHNMTSDEVASLMQSIKPILDPNIIWFGYYKDEPIGFLISLPEINQIVKYLNGKMNWIAKLKFLWYKHTKVCEKASGIAFGVIPEHQGKGIDGALVWKLDSHLRKIKNPYEKMEMNWIGSFNPKMIIVARQIGTRVIKTHTTYRKLFDESLVFKRLKVMN